MSGRYGTIHVIGAGLAGLSAAVHLATAGRKVVLYESGAQAGGRCRSYFDRELSARIDNGNHLMLACNEAVMGYLDLIGALSTLHVAEKADFRFTNVETGQRWTVSIGDGRFPSWIFNPQKRVPDTRWWDYLEGRKLLAADRFATVAEVLDSSTALYRNFWAPMCVSIMNTAPHEASARLLGRVFAEAFGMGGGGCRPMTVREGLSESFVEPALAYLAKRGGDVRFGARLKAIGIENDEVRALHVAGETIELQQWDWVVLAVPAWAVNDLLPGVSTPTAFRSIVNAHFKYEGAVTPHALQGVVGGASEWVFEKPGILSTTSSAAERLVDKEADELAALLWRDVARLYALDPAQVPPYRIVKEKRATFAATPDEVIRRPPIGVRHSNLVLCGDWTDTKLPSTIEGALRSGRAAAAAILPPSDI